VLALLAATAVAFAITEGAKLQRSPIYGTDVTKVFSPSATIVRVASPTGPRTYGTKYATIKFKLRSAQNVDVWIQDEDGNVVRTLLFQRRFPRAHTVKASWDGFADDGTVARAGTYRPVVELGGSHLKITLPNPIVLDATPPAITVRKIPHEVISPDGDRHADTFSIPYRLSEPAHAILRVLPAGSAHAQQVEFTLFQRRTGTLVWNGKFKGAPATPGNYVLYAAAQDTAGNLAKGTPFAVVQVRYLSLGRSRVVVKPGARFALRVSTDAPVVHWTLHGRSGTARRGTLHLRAPKSIGVFHLYVTAAGHAAQTTVVVG
jgi:hypothetical protein